MKTTILYFILILQSSLSLQAQDRHETVIVKTTKQQVEYAAVATKAAKEVWDFSNDGLDWYDYDYGARMYDPGIGRFMSMDRKQILIGKVLRIPQYPIIPINLHMTK